MTETQSAGVNAEQVRRWNNESGLRWVAERKRNAAARDNILPHLWRAVALRPGDRVLDVGCGCGETTVVAARSVQPGGSVLGLDVSAPMLAVARELAEGLSNIDFIQGDAQVHPLPPAAFDAVISSFGVMFFDDPAAAFTNLRGSLKPGGRLAFLCWQGNEHNEVFSIALRAFDVTPTEQDMFADREWIIGMLEGVGYAGVEVTAVNVPARIGSDVADVVRFHTTSSMALRLNDPDRVERAAAILTREFATLERPDGVWVNAGAWLVTAHAPG
jgi:SAM-dependent methyltransferase